MDIEQSFLNKEKSFCYKKLGSELLNKNNIKYNEIKNDCKIHYCRLNNRFTLLVPMELDKLEKEQDKLEKNNYMSIDPGVRTFLTGLCNDKKFEICTNSYKEIKKILQKIDKLKLIKFKNLKKKKNKLRLKLKNKITDLHWKSINYLIKQNKNTIIIGKWSTKSCISNNNKKQLNPMLKRVCSSLRYYQFLQKLKYKSHYNNITLKIQDESFTSIMCSTCGIINDDLGSSKIFNCSNCKNTYDRDMNACRNILIKSLN